MNAAKPKIRILLADDHLVVRMGLAAIFSVEKDLELVGEAGDGLAAVRLCRETHPDVVIMDIMMPKLGGAEAAERILKDFPRTKILILTTYGTSDDTKRALDAGACGALVKDSSKTVIIDAIRRVAAGERVISPEIRASINQESSCPELTERQLEILRYVSKGLSTAEIARLAKVGPDCVKSHLKTIFVRLGASTRAEAVTIALSKKLLKI